LTAFGIDSAIELASAAVLVWRLNVELRHGGVIAKNAGRTASRIAGALFVLAAYVVASAAWKLWTRQGAAHGSYSLAQAATPRRARFGRYRVEGDLFSCNTPTQAAAAPLFPDPEAKKSAE
jgi:hypothetical protein